MTDASDGATRFFDNRQGRQRMERARASHEARIRQRVEYFAGLGRTPEEIARFVGVPVEDVLAELPA